MTDHSSFANFVDIRVTHGDFDLSVDLTAQVITGTAVLKTVVVAESTDRLILDTRDLTIRAARKDGQDAKFELGEVSEALGASLTVMLEPPATKGEEVSVAVDFMTSPECTAIQFLEPEQTAGGEHPYLFSQCQAIHCRSMIPLQDSPSVKMTYAARVTVPAPLTALMSAVIQNDGKPVSVDGDLQTFAFDQTVAIPAYLIAIVVGHLESRDIGPRSKVWSEPSMVAAGEYEFGNTEDYVKAAEEVAGPYVWGRYDILLLPPSFPYGGMENPCLTFATPTLLAGDRSLTNVVAHEVAHSWTGNLVTNRTWEHFWLNEGCNVYLERKILQRLHGIETFNLHAESGKGELLKACQNIGEEHNFTKLVPDLSGGKDPDDAFSRIPYEKGFYFNVYLQNLVGEARYEAWFKDQWIQGHAHTTADSDEWKRCFTQAFPEESGRVDWDTWLYAPGTPKEAVVYNDTLGKASRALAEAWQAAGESAEFGSAEDVAGWDAKQFELFLDKVSEKPLPLATCRRLGEVYGLTKSRNSEVRHRWYDISIMAGNSDVLESVVQFITEQGRMKFVRPLYRALFGSDMGKQLALDTFAKYRATYHPVCQKMVAVDLQLRGGDVARD